MNLAKCARIFLRWFARMFPRKSVGMSLDKNAVMCQERSAVRFPGSIRTISLFKNVTLLMFPYVALYPVNPAVMFQNRFQNWFPDKNATVNQER